MNAFIIDEKTGFLTAPSDERITFDALKKVRILEIAEEMVQRGEMPRLSILAKAVGVDTDTIIRHRKEDVKFGREWERVIDLAEETLVGTMFAQGQKPSGYMDRITWLRAYRPGRWNPDRQVQFHGDISITQKVSSALTMAIEAEVLPDTEELPTNSPVLEQLPSLSTEEHPLEKGIDPSIEKLK